MGYYAMQTDNSIKHFRTPGSKNGHRSAPWYPIAAWKAHLQRIGKASNANAIDDKKSKKTQKELDKQKAANLQKAREAKAKAAELKKTKAEIIKNGDVDKAAKMFDEFTNEELAAVENRNRAKMSITKAKTDAVMSKMGTLAEATQRISNITMNSINIYNNIVKVANTFGDKNLPIISNNFQNNQNNQNNDNSKKK